jgi:hypothetical protein
MAATGAHGLRRPSSWGGGYLGPRQRRPAGWGGQTPGGIARGQRHEKLCAASGGCTARDRRWRISAKAEKKVGERGGIRSWEEGKRGSFVGLNR